MEEQGLALLRATTLSSVRPLSLWLRVQPDSRVGSRREDPRLCGVKDDIQDAQVPGDIVSSKNFDRHNERILQEVIVDHAVTHNYGAVIRSGGKERVLSVEGHRPQSFLMMSEDLVRFCGEIHVKPGQLGVITSIDQIVTCRVYGDAGDPLAVGEQLLGQLLLQQIVDSYISLCGHEEEWAGGMELDSLDLTFAFAEWVLAASAAELMYEDLSVPIIREDYCKIVPATMPCHLLYCLLMLDPEPKSLIIICPLCCCPGHRLLLLLLRCLVRLQMLICGTAEEMVSKARVQNDDCVLHTCGHQHQGGVRVPAHTFDGPVQTDSFHTTTGTNFPEPECGVVRARNNPLPGGRDIDTTHKVCVPTINHRLHGGKRLQISGFGQFGDQVLRIYIDPHLSLARTQVQVQAALKSLVYEAGICGNGAQGTVLLGNKR